LFSRNVESRDQLIALTKSLRALFPQRKIFIFVDQEGGRVARIKPPIAEKLHPVAKKFADIYMVDPTKAKSLVKENYAQIMAELNSLGIDSPCAPVCDIYYEDANPIIGDRSFGSTPGQVIDLCKEAIAGINEQGGIAFIKHIPGHGRAKTDSHLSLPIINTDLKTLEETDFKVFRELSKEKVWGMGAHIVYDALDAKKPAMLSNKVIDYIRNQIGFKGILVTDDICMWALHGKVGEQKALLIKVARALRHKESGNDAQKNFQALFAEDFKKLFAIDITEKNRQEIIELLRKS
jgi:beta-glucosidase-like glycosyl hydrolase